METKLFLALRLLALAAIGATFSVGIVLLICGWLDRKKVCRICGVYH